MTSPSAKDVLFKRHKTVARMVGMALWLHDRLSYAMLAKGLVQNLPPAEIHGLAHAALWACAPDKAWRIAHDRLEGYTENGPPDPPDWEYDLNPDWIMADAMAWAGAATEFQRKAYGMACLAHMSDEEREAIVRGLAGRST